MGQVRHGSATTTHAIRAAIQRSQASTAALSRELGINPKTVAKWRKRETVEDLKTGPKEPRSTVLREAEEAMGVALRRHTLLPLDDCLYALQPSIPHLTRSALHRCLQRHGISRLPDVEGDKPKRQRFKRYPIGFFHMDIAELQTVEGKLYLFVAIDRTSKVAVAQLVEKADRRTAWEFLEHLLEMVPCRIHTILTERAIEGAIGSSPMASGIQFAEQPRNRNTIYSRQMRFAVSGACAAPPGPRSPPTLRGQRDRASPDQAQPSVEFGGSENSPGDCFPDKRPSRATEPDNQGRDRQTLPRRDPRSAVRAPRRLYGGLQLRSQTQDPLRPHALRIHLQSLDFRPGQIHRQSDPPEAGTEHFGPCVGGDRAALAEEPAWGTAGG